MTRHWLLPQVSQLKIVKKNLEVTTLGASLTPVQRHIIEITEQALSDGRPVRCIILKARQMGVSTIIEAIGFVAAFALSGLRGLVVAHDNPSAEHILSMTHFYWDTWKFKELFTPTSRARNRLSWEETNSMLTISTARNVATGRSRTLQFLHNSEVAFYPEPEELMKALNQAIPREPFTFQYLESTANGVGNWFYRFWQAACNNETDTPFYPLFYPWWRHPFYRAEHIGLGYRVTRPLTNLSEEEKIIARALTRQGIDSTEIKSRLIWRRSIITTECGGDLQTFHQEYPSTPEEAFIATGNNVFDSRLLDKVFEPIEPERGELVREAGKVRFIPRFDGDLFIYRRPEPDGFYMVGADASKAATKGDYAVAQVIDRRTFEQVATFRRRMIPELFAQEVMKIGDFYNHAMLVPETNMSGGAVAAILRTSYYDNVFMHRKANRVPGQIDRMFGWITNAQTKTEAIGSLVAVIHDECDPDNLYPPGFRIHDVATYHEMRGYVTNDRGGYENSSADNVEHDDTVMALAIAVVAAKYEANNLPEPKTRFRRTEDLLEEHGVKLESYVKGIV